MAFPQVQTTNAAATADGTSHVFVLPSGVAENDLLLIFAGSGLDTAAITKPGDWNELYNGLYQTTMHAGAWWKKAGASESNPTFTTAASSQVSYVAYRVNAWDQASTPAFGTPVSGTSTTPNPPACTPSWGALDTLWIAVAHGDSVETVTAIPTSYSNGVHEETAYTQGTARRELNAASEDPATFTFSVNDQWVATTIGIRPAAAAGGTAALTGTATSALQEAQVVNGGKTIILTLTGDTYLAAGTGPIGSTANTQDLINGIDSAQSGANGWDARVKTALVPATHVVRTSATVATITLPAVSNYSIAAKETITATIPASVLTGASPIVATPTFTVAQAVNAVTANVALTGIATVLRAGAKTYLRYAK